MDEDYPSQELDPFDIRPEPETTESAIISSKSQLTEKAINDILEMQKENSEEFRETLRKQKDDTLNVQQTEEYSKFNIPIRVIIPAEHIHLENEIPNDDKKYLKYNYLVLKEDKPDYHGHLDNDIPESVIRSGESSEIYKSEDGLIKYKVSSDYKTNTKKMLELKPILEYETFTPSPIQGDENDVTEKEIDILETLFYYMPWW